MADKKISELTNITGANLADADEFVVVDTSASETKAITWAELKEGLDTGTGFVRITGDTMTGNLSFGDNDKAIFGAESDLQIFHNGTDSVIREVGTGSLYLGTNNQIVMYDTNNGEELAVFNRDGDVQLKYNNATKLATTSTGVDVTGTVTADGLTVDGDVTFGSGSEEVLLFTGGASNSQIKVRDNNALEIKTGTEDSEVNRLKITNGGDISFYEDTGTTPKFFWDASAEALGIGTTSPSDKLHILGSGETGLRIDDSGTARYAEVTFGTTNGAMVIGSQGASPYPITFETADTERMRIDASGNLLVGKTSADFGSTQGVELRPTGNSYFTSDGGNALRLNRLTSDGDIVTFRKDGTTVGSIGTQGGDLTIYSSATSHGGIRFAQSGILATDNSGALSDATRDIGQTDYRWKDLYLSGGVYLGGTGAANKLDDYEEGTWTITDGSGAGLSFTVQDNVYTKVGRLVVASANITWPSTANTSSARIVLPFTSIANNSHSGGVVTEQNWNTLITLTASCNYTDGVIFRQRGALSLTNAELSGKKLRFTVTYHAA